MDEETEVREEPVWGHRAAVTEPPLELSLNFSLCHSLLLSTLGLISLC